MTAVLTFDEALARSTDQQRHLLLGSGFSVAFDDRLGYKNLFDQAKKNRLDEKQLKVFDRLRSTNFESCLRFLDDAGWAAEHFLADPAVVSTFRGPYEDLRRALVETIAELHPANQKGIEESRRARAGEFLSRFHHLFSTNYDLIAYWVVMTLKDAEGNYIFGDGFFRDPADGPLVFKGKLSDRGIFYLHGALHLTATDPVEKLSNKGRQKKLKDQIDELLNAKTYPLIVTEGTAADKLVRIETNEYLRFGFESFAKIEGALYTFGHSLGEADAHLGDAIALNPNLRQLFVGIYGDADSQTGLDLRKSVGRICELRAQQGLSALEFKFYDAKSVGL